MPQIPKDTELARLRRNFGSSNFITGIGRRVKELSEQRKAGPTNGAQFGGRRAGPAGSSPLATRRAPPSSPVAGPRPIQPLRPLINRPRRFVPESSSRRFIRGGF